MSLVRWGLILQVVDGIVVIVRALIERGWWSNDDFVVCIFLLFGMLILRSIFFPQCLSMGLFWYALLLSRLHKEKSTGLF